MTPSILSLMRPKKRLNVNISITIKASTRSMTIRNITNTITTAITINTITFMALVAHPITRFTLIRHRSRSTIGSERRL